MNKTKPKYIKIITILIVITSFLVICYILGFTKIIHLNPDNLSVWIPIFIGVLSLVFTISYSFYQLKRNRKEDRIKNKPILTTHFTYELGKRIILELKNNGLGSGLNVKLLFNYRKGKNLNLNTWFSYSLLSSEIIWDKHKRMNDSIFNINPLSNHLILDIQTLHKFKWENVIKILNETELIVEYENVYNEKQKPEIIKLDYLKRIDDDFNKGSNMLYKEDTTLNR